MAYLDKSPDEARARQAKKEDKRENAAIIKAEAMLAKMMREGKVNPGNLRKVKEEIARKTGAYPVGSAN